MKKILLLALVACAVGYSAHAADVDPAEMKKALEIIEKKVAKPSFGGAIEIEFRRLKTLNALPAELFSLYRLDRLVLSGTGVQSLKGLTAAMGLKTLRLYDNKLSDLSPITDFTTLRTLMLNSDKVSDYTPIGTLVGLNSLELSKCITEDYSPLGNLAALRVLSLNYCDLPKEADFIRHLGRLEILTINNSEVADFSNLAGLTSVKTMYLANIDIPDLGFLANFKAIKYLSLRSSDVEDFEGLTHLSAVSTLVLEGTGIKKLSLLSGLNTLADLDIRKSRASDFTPLASLIGLRRLNLGRTIVEDLSFTENMYALERLVLADSEVEDLSPIAHLTLENLDISSTGVSDFSTISKMANLRELRLNELRIKDLNFLKGLNMLSTIYLKDLKGDVPDLAILATLPSLKRVIINDASDKQLEPLSNNEKIKVSKY